MFAEYISRVLQTTLEVEMAFLRSPVLPLLGRLLGACFRSRVLDPSRPADVHGGGDGLPRKPGAPPPGSPARSPTRSLLVLSLCWWVARSREWYHRALRRFRLCLGLVFRILVSIILWWLCFPSSGFSR